MSAVVADECFKHMLVDQLLLKSTEDFMFRPQRSLLFMCSCGCADYSREVLFLQETQAETKDAGRTEPDHYDDPNI